MKILVTGSAGRIGRNIYIHLMRMHEVVGLDLTPCSTVDYIGDIRNPEFSYAGVLELLDNGIAEVLPV